MDASWENRLVEVEKKERERVKKLEADLLALQRRLEAPVPALIDDAELERIWQANYKDLRHMEYRRVFEQALSARDLLARMEALREWLQDRGWPSNEHAATLTEAIAALRSQEASEPMSVFERKVLQVHGTPPLRGSVQEATVRECVKWHREQAAKQNRGITEYAWQTEGEGENPYLQRQEFHEECATAILSRFGLRGEKP